MTIMTTFTIGALVPVPQARVAFRRDFAILMARGLLSTPTREYYGAGTSTTSTTTATSSNTVVDGVVEEQEQEQEQEQQAVQLRERLKHNESHIRGSVERIRHLPQEGSIEIQLSANSSCPNPYVIGRLSGPHLAMIQWQPPPQPPPPRPASASASASDDHGIMILRGTYSVPTVGRYFIEILGMLCQSFTTLEDDYSNICLDDPGTTGRLTDVDAVIDVVKTAPAHHQAVGYWQWSRSSKNDSDSDSDSLPVAPLQTRYQPQDCRPKRRNWNSNQFTERCTNATSLDRFDPYQFVWTKTTHAEMTLRNHDSSKQKDDEWICLIGASHSKLMRTQFYQWLGHFKITNVKIEHLDVKIPSDLSEASI
jgi:hypothetical protein